MRLKFLSVAGLALASLALSNSSFVADIATNQLSLLTAKTDTQRDTEHAIADREGGRPSHASATGQQDTAVAGDHAAGGHHPVHRILATTPIRQDITLTERYVCQIHSRRHIEIRALEEGYLGDVHVDEGQAVRAGDSMFSIVPTLYQANLDSDLAEAQLAQVEYDNTRKLVQQQIVSDQELKLAAAKLAKAQAKVERAQAELEFANLKAPFDGIIDRLHEQKGSLLEEGARLTTLSDNEVMWVYFNVPEARYLEYQEMINGHAGQDELEIKLKLANHKLFSEKGAIGAIEAEFNNETGNIAFRADFNNPEGLLRHGQTGTVLIQHVETDALVIPQRATYEILAKTYVYVIDSGNVVHQREVEIQNEQDDIFIIAAGLEAGERIILEGLRQVRDGDKVEYDLQDPQLVLSNLKYHAE